jgi:hypothetical protein
MWDRISREREREMLDKLLNELVALYRGWDQLEQELDPDGQAVIDFDFAKDRTTPFEFQTRFEVLGKLKHFQALLPQNMEFLHARLNASIWYISALMGQQFPFKNYIASTMGVEPYPFTEEAIEQQKRKVVALLAQLNVGFTHAGLQEFEDRYLLIDEAEIAARFSEAKDDAFARLRNFVALPPLPNIRITFQKENAYWQNWIKGNANEITLTVNIHPRARIYDGIPQLLAYHELAAHAVQIASWFQRIEQGNLHPIYGITTVHSPEQFIAEGLAQTLTNILLEDAELPIQALMAREYERYRLMVYNNAHILINEQKPINAVCAYVGRNLPFEATYSIEAELKDRSTDPLLRSYQYVYSVSEDFFLKYVAPLSVSQKKEVLPTIYHEPLIRHSLQDILSLSAVAQ